MWRAGLVSSTGDWVSILAAISLGERLAGSGGIVLVLVSRILPGLFFGAVGDFDQVIAGDCLIGNGGTHTSAPPAGDVWFLVAGREGSRYSSVGQAASGERALTGVELLCGGDLEPDTSAGCP